MRLKAASGVSTIGLAVLLSACGVKQGALDEQLASMRDEMRQEIQAGDDRVANRVDQVDQRVNALSGLTGRLEALERELEGMRTEFQAEFQRLQGAIRFNAPVHFTYDSDQVRDEDRQLLDRFARVVNEFYPTALITVEGFADPAGDADYNLQLGKRRADAVKAYLASAGLSADRVRTASYGEAQNRQVTPGAWGETGLPNRRAALVIDYSASGAMPTIASDTEE